MDRTIEKKKQPKVITHEQCVIGNVNLQNCKNNLSPANGTVSAHRDIVLFCFLLESIIVTFTIVVELINSPSSNISSERKGTN